MIIGIPREIKVKENRVACTPGGVRVLAGLGHQVLVETGAGVGSGYSDEQYAEAGARLVGSASEAWAAEMVVKVKEPLAPEFQYLRPDLVLFTYLHLAAAPELTRALLESRTTGIAYETVSLNGRLPLLEPMSEIAGRMASIVGAYYLGKPQGGTGVLLGGVPGVLPGKVVIIGGGTAGVNAARMALGLGAEVTILDVDLNKLRHLDLTLGGTARTLYSNEQNLLDLLPGVDLLIGAVLVPGARAPRLVRREMLGRMKPGSVFVDIAVDQGGCAETTRATTHDDPVYLEHGITHYCVANMPGAYARTATQALTNVTIPYAARIATLGVETALRQLADLRGGLNTWKGGMTHPAVAEACGCEYQPVAFGCAVEMAAAR